VLLVNLLTLQRSLAFSPECFENNFHQVVLVLRELHFHIRGYLSEANTYDDRCPSLGVHECDSKHGVVEARFVIIQASLQQTNGFNATVATEMGMSWDTLLCFFGAETHFRR
jgi:hypothetical protein